MDIITPALEALKIAIGTTWEEKDKAIEGLKAEVASLKARVAELEKPPIVVGATWTTIDRGLTIDKCNRASTPGLFLKGERDKKYGSYKITRSGPVEFQDCHNLQFDTFDLSEVYGFYPRRCTNFTIERLVLNDTWIGVKWLEQVSGWKVKYIESNGAKDRDPALTSPNGDGITIDDISCVNNWIGTLRCSNNADAGADVQGNGTIIDDYYASGNKHGIKAWGITTFKKALIEKSSGNSILAISGDTMVLDATLRTSGDVHVKLGLSAYADRKKKLTITGKADKWPSFTKDVNSTLIANMVQG